MKYISFCSGIEAASQAWHPLGWEPLAFCEIDKNASRILAHHYPNVPNLGDFTKVDWQQWRADVCVGGTPCQAFSVAGLRKSLSDERGNLSLEFIRAVNIIRPRFVVWENVPGVLSTPDNAFGCFLAGLVGCEEPIVFEQGWPNAGVVDGPLRRCAWRVLDAQYFGLAQRRRRVFVVASSGDGPHPAEILFEWEGLRRDSPPRREAGEGVAGTIAARTRGGGGLGTDFECDGGLISQGCSGEIAPTLNSAFGSKLGLDNQHIDSGAGLFVTHSLRADGFDASATGPGRGTPLVPVAYTLQCNGINHAGTQKTDTGKTLRLLREEVGAEAITQWGLGVLDSLQQAQVLRHEMLRQDRGRRTKVNESGLDGVTSPCAEDLPYWAMRALRISEGIGRSPQGQRLAEQFARELGADLPKLPHERAQAAWLMSCLWQASEGLGVLRQALSALQEIWRPVGGQNQPAHPHLAVVRRLTPREAERLQGFPDNYTAIGVPMAGEAARTKINMADGPRYKALGNSMAVPVMAWIGKRLNKIGFSSS
jgi:DNA (cytosine-5)-methyltransferase 1